MRSRLFLACLCFLWCPVLAGAQQSVPAPAQPVDGVTQLVMSIEEAVAKGDAEALRALATGDVRVAQLSDFVQSMTFPRVSRSSIKERDRARTGDRVRLLLEVLTERGIEGRVTSWRMDAEPGAGADAPWKFAHIERLTNVSGLFRLSLDGATEYDVRNLVVTAPDLTLTLPAGSAFLSRTPDGATAVVLLGRGRLQFSPQQEAERGQLRIFAGREILATDFESVFVRVNPDEFDRAFAAAALTPRAVNARHLRRAKEVFETYLPKSFQIDLNDLSTSRWSLVPSGVDFVAEIVTKKFGALTYARAMSEPEDISFFDRRRHRNIAVYSTDARLDARGRFFSEDDRADYDVTHYDIQASFEPDRMWVDGTTRLMLRPRGAFLSTVTLRLAEPLVVRSVWSPHFGRLLHMRVVGQNNMLVGFPSTIVAGTDVEIVITYGGRLPPQGVEREAVTIEHDGVQDDVVVIPLEPQYTYSNRSYWYPQATVTDYATAKLTVTVPGDLDAVASGAQQGPPTIVPGPPGQRNRKQFVFDASRPTRYLAVLISRFQSGTPVLVTLRDGSDAIALKLAANPRQVSKVRNLTEKTTEILKFYTGLLEHAPYEAFTLALTENDVPGGHSPAYFALLNNPLPTSPFVWTNDPVSFPGYPSFFIAHEIAHQWWGQAVGWKNYHEQWLSEGFAQYFAALFAERERGPGQFAAVLRQMRKTAIETSPQGPVYLGYRLGHIRNEGRVFRALVYNKGAMVLHMLRRLIGDEAFFAGLRDFYATWRYRKAGTDDFRTAMEKAGRRPLGRFFDRWIFGSSIPSVRFTSRVDGDTLHVRFEQTGDLFDVPIAVTVSYADGTSQTVFVAVTEEATAQAIPLKGTVRAVEANTDNGALVTIER
jgi:hypothetical protein